MGIMITFVFYFLIFAVVHSLFATDIVKGSAEKMLGKKFRFYRLFYILSSMLTFAPAFFVWISNSSYMPEVYIIPCLFYPFIILIRLAAIILIVYAAVQFDILDFIGIRQLIRKNGNTKKKLMTGSAYGIVRHPLYTGIIILLFTKMEMTLLDLVAFLLFSVYFMIGGYIEERRLLAVFGEDYRKYQENVSMFIPFKKILKPGKLK